MQSSHQQYEEQMQKSNQQFASQAQQQSYQNQHNLENQRYNANTSYMNTANNNGWDPYGGCCGGSSSGISSGGAAALGMAGGMAMGAAMESAAQPRQPTTIVENVGGPATGPVPIGTTVPVLPAGANPTQVNGQYYYYANGTYYKPVFNGSQVVYVASPG